MYTKPSKLFTYLALITLCMFAGCSASTDHRRPIRTGAVPMPIREGDAQTNFASQRFPWVTWNEGESFSGLGVTKALLDIDASLNSRNISDAVNLVKANISSPQNVDELARSAAVSIADGKGSEALASLSRYYTSKHLSEESVSGPMTILFGFAYALKNSGSSGASLDDEQQSLAWFARNLRQQNRAPDARSSFARDAVTYLVRSMRTEDIEAVRPQWRDEEAVDSVVSAELTARATDPHRTAVALASLWTQGNIGSTPTSTTALAEEVVTKWRILALLPLSGKYSSLATPVRQGIELAALEHSPPDVEVVVRDDAASITQARALVAQSNSANTLIAVLGPMNVELAQALQQDTHSLGIPQVSFARGKEFIPEEGTYRFGLTGESQVASVLTAYAKTLPEAPDSNRTIAAVLPDDASGRELADPLDAYARQLGLTLTTISYFQKGNATSLSNLALEVENASPGAVFFGDNIVAAARFFSAISAKKRKFITPLGSSLWDDQRALQQSRTVLEGAIFPTGFFTQNFPPTDPTPTPPVDGTVAITDGVKESLADSFQKHFQERYSKTPNFLAAQGYDATVLVLQGLRQDGEKRTVSLQGQTLDGASGTSIIGENGEIARKLTVVRFLQGELHPVH